MTEELGKGERMARALDWGCGVVNERTKSDTRRPVGGMKESGYGRELSHHGLDEFVNAKTVWVDA